MAKKVKRNKHTRTTRRHTRRAAPVVVAQPAARVVRQSRQSAQRERQEAVALRNRDLSTDELGVRIDHTNTLIAMYDAQRVRNLRVIADSNSDLRTCKKMIDELQHDVVTLNTLVRVRKSL